MELPLNVVTVGLLSLGCVYKIHLREHPNSDNDNRFLLLLDRSLLSVPAPTLLSPNVKRQYRGLMVVRDVVTALNLGMFAPVDYFPDISDYE